MTKITKCSSLGKIFCSTGRGKAKTILLVLFALCFMPELPAGETIFESDFAAALPKNKMILSRASVENGMLQIGNKTGSFWADATLSQEVDSPFVLSYSMRVTGFSRQDKHQVGVFLSTTTGKTYQLHSSQGLFYGLQVFEKKRIVEKRYFSEDVKIELGDNNRFFPVELCFDAGFVAMKVDGHALGVFPLDFAPVKEIKFYAMNAQLQIDAMKIVVIDKAKTSYCEQPVFTVDFNESVNAVDENGKPIIPTSDAKPNIVPGMDGNALEARKDKKFKTLTYDVGPLLGDAGAIMFWSCPQERFMKTIQLLDKNGKERMGCMAQSFGYAMDLMRPDGSKYNFFSRGSKLQTHLGSWNHYALTWDKKGAIRIFRNGLPYTPNYAWEPNVGFSPGMDLSDVRKIQILDSCGSLIDDLKLFRKEVSPDAVYSEFRKKSPLDVVIADAVVEPKEDAAFVLELAPGGTYTRSSHVGAPISGVKGELTITLHPLEKQEKTLKTLTCPIEVKDKPVKIKFPVGKLPEGEYVVMCQIKFPDGKLMGRGSFAECVALPEKAAEATTRDVELGKLVFERSFTSADDKSLLREGNLHAVDGKYLEVGENNGDRFSCVLPELKDFIQKPMILEITWPDDKQRMMGLYMYLEQKGEAMRDRLEGGVQAGREIPNSGEMVRTRYLFYPQSPTCLFEARTLANGFPAAVAELKLYEIKGGRLPKLKINYPKGMDHRRIGFVDEDQTLLVTMAKRDLKGLSERILDYMDYTGQDAFHTQLVRYYFSSFPYPGCNGNFWPLPGEMGYLIDAIGSRDKELTGIINLSTIPEVYYAPCVGHDLSKTGMVALDKDLLALTSYEGVKGTPNIACPAVREAYVRYIEDLAVDLRKPAVKAISFWNTMGWDNLDKGYDDYTVDKFSAETGIEVPDSGRFEFLTSAQILPKWSAWRAKQVFELIKATRETLDRINPELLIYVMKRNNYDWDPYLDPMLKELPRTYACDYRRPTSYRCGFHWGAPESDLEEGLYDYPAAKALRERKSNQHVSLFYAYYETYVKPLDNKNYGCYFQSADVKPHGRHFLKELAFNVAATDALEIGFGGQPFGSFGRDEETREFARAFAALPNQSFKTTAGSNGSVTVRYFNTENGTYLYVVSGVWSGSKAIFAWPKDMEYTDLSTGNKLTGGTIALKPYELRSFLIPDKKIVVDSFAAEFPPELKAFYPRRIAELEAAVKEFEKRGMPVADEKARISQIKNALDSENYAEAHRLAWSVIMNQLLLNMKAIDLLSEQESIIKKNKFAVNCGSSSHYRSADGRLFFPDQKFSGKNKYGYYGNYNSCVRKIDNLKEKVAPLLYQTEAYDIDGYKFRLANGKYTLRLYLKAGFPPEFNDNEVIFSAYAQGKPLFKELDMYKASKGDFTQPIVKEFKNIEVVDGELTLKFDVPPGQKTSHRLCDAIEITPEKQ